MSIDSEAKRRSVIHFLMPFYPATGQPTDVIESSDRFESAWNYAGLWTGAPFYISFMAFTPAPVFTVKKPSLAFEVEKPAPLFVAEKPSPTFEVEKPAPKVVVT